MYYTPKVPTLFKQFKGVNEGHWNGCSTNNRI